MPFYTEDEIQRFEKVEFLYITVASEGHVFRITLNRPEKRNAFTPMMAREIAFALAYAQYNPEIRCVILDAKGPVFCAGADLNSFHDPTVDPENPTLPESKEEIRLGDAFAQLHKPSIAQVEGPVLAGGFLIICGCTFVISVEDALYSLPEVKRGIWPMQVMASMLQIMSPRKILEMSITGDTYSAKHALDFGLVTQLSTAESINRDVSNLAELICSNAPFAITNGIQSLRAISQISEGERHSYLKKQLDVLLQSEDAKEGTIAFKQKRNPVWKGK